MFYDNRAGDTALESCWKWAGELQDDNPSALSSLDLEGKVFPETKEGFKLPKLSNGKNGCIYKGNRNEPGTITCDGQLTIKCIQDPFTTSVLSCEPKSAGDDFDWPLYPKVSCIVQ